MDLNLNAAYKNKCIDFAEDNNEKEEAKKNLNEFEMEDDFEEEEGEGYFNNVDEMDENDEESDFLDNSGKIWNFACEILDERHLKKWCRKMGAIIVSKDEKLTRQYECSIEECPFQIIFLKTCSIVYTRNEHNHGEENTTKNIQIKQEVENNEQDHVDKHGKVWSFRARIGKNYHKDIFRKEFRLSHIKKSKTHLYMCCQHRSPAGGKCRFTGIFLESNGYLYTRGEHEQHSKKRKHHKILATIMRINIAEFGNLKKKLAKIFNPKYCTTNMDLQEFDQIKQH